MMKERLKLLDRIYWIRVISSISAGLLCGILFNLTPQPQTTISILLTFYVISSIAAMLVDKKRITGMIKIYLHGIGTFIVLWFTVFSLYLTLVYAFS